MTPRTRLGRALDYHHWAGGHGRWRADVHLHALHRLQLRWYWLDEDGRDPDHEGVFCASWGDANSDDVWSASCELTLPDRVVRAWYWLNRQRRRWAGNLGD